MKRKLILSFALMLMCGALYAQPKVIAHRGYWKTEGSAQNSLASFVKADEIAAFGAEMDVWLTADGHIVVNHDTVFKGTDINMETSSFEDIRSIRLANGEQIPTLEEYLKVVKKHKTPRLVLEMKPLSNRERETEAVDKIVKALKKYKLVKRTDFISFSLNACKLFHERMPEIKVYYLGGQYSPKEIKEFGFAGMDYHMAVYRNHPDWVRECRELGLETNVWTVNRKADLQEFIDRGVDYITTNEPELLQSLLKK